MGRRLAQINTEKILREQGNSFVGSGLQSESNVLNKTTL